MERKHFKKALDIFAQFFIEPLMKRESVDKEIKAVDSGELASLSHPLAGAHRQWSRLLYCRVLYESDV